MKKSTFGPVGEISERPRRSPPTTILFLCTHNSARSLMAEAILNRRAFRLDGPAPLRAYSAGEHPSARPHPLTLEVLKERGYATAFAKPQNWRDYAAPTAPRIDLILQVCERDPEPPMPRLTGLPSIIRWPTPDPVAIEGGPDSKRRAFAACYALLEGRIGALLSDVAERGPLNPADPVALRSRLSAIGADFKSPTS